MESKFKSNITDDVSKEYQSKPALSRLASLMNLNLNYELLKRITINKVGVLNFEPG